jgi:hypothetical protein
MLEGELGEVGVLVSGEAGEHDLRERRGLLRGVERQSPLLQREPVDVAVEGCVGVRGELEREAGLAEAAEDGVVVAQRRRAGGGPRLHQADRPAMSRQDGPDRDGPLAHGLLPTFRRGRQLDLAEDQVDHAVEQVLLVGDVVVQGHRLDPHRLGEPAHRERLDSVLVGERGRGAQDPVAAQGDAGRWRGIGRGGHSGLLFCAASASAGRNSLTYLQCTCSLHCKHTLYAGPARASPGSAARHPRRGHPDDAPRCGTSQPAPRQ